MVVAKWKPEFGFKDVIYVVTLLIALAGFGLRQEAMTQTNAQTVEVLDTLVCGLDNRVTVLEKARLAEESYEAGYQKALKDAENED